MKPTELSTQHLAAYLPYGVKLRITNFQADYVGIEFAEMTGIYPVGKTPHATYVGGSTGKSSGEMMLQLRPLSQLTETIEHNGERFIPNHRYPMKYWVEADLEYFIGNISTADYHQIQYLHFLHFDTFGLLEANLAEPIPSIEQP